MFNMGPVYNPTVQSGPASTGSPISSWSGHGGMTKGPAAKPFDWGAMLRPQQQQQAPRRNVGFQQGATGFQSGPLQRSKFDTAGIASMVGGKSGPSPEITVGPIWNDQQVQGRVNQMRAGADQETAGNVNRMAQSTASRGFGTNSPLQQALQAQMQGANLASKMGQENDIRWGAAQGNRKMTFDTQKARSDQFADRMAEDIERRRNQAGIWMAALNGPEGMDYGFGTSEAPTASPKAKATSDPRPADVVGRQMTPAETLARQQWWARQNGPMGFRV